MIAIKNDPTIEYDKNTAKRIRPTVEMEYFDIFIRKHTVDRYMITITTVQHTVDLKEETQKQVMKTLQCHNLGKD